MRYATYSVGLAGSLAGFLAGSFAGCSVGAFAGSLAGAFVGSLAGSFPGAFAGALAGGLAGAFAGSLADSLAGAFAGSLVAAFAGSLVGGLEADLTGGRLRLYVPNMLAKSGAKYVAQNISRSMRILLFLCKSYPGLSSLLELRLVNADLLLQLLHECNVVLFGLGRGDTLRLLFIVALLLVGELRD